jgi:hypothetical protein
MMIGRIRSIIRRLSRKGADPARIHYILLASVLVYGLVISLVKIDYNSVFVDEAYHIVMGRQLAAGETCPGCAAHTGSVMTWPLFASFGDSFGGLYGARIMNIIMGLALTVCIYLATRMLVGRDLGLLAAAIFIFSGQALYLMKLATYDMTAALFLGGAFLMTVAAHRAVSPAYEAASLITATILLSLAAITKYLLPAFIPAFLIYVIVRHGAMKGIIFALIPMTVFMTMFFWFSPYPPNPQVIYQIENAREVSSLPIATIFDWTFRWLSLAYLLAAFGLFHERHRRLAALLILASTPILLIHIITRAEASVNKNVMFAIIFLAPAGAMGIDHISHLFSMRETSRAVKVFFTVSVVTVVWAYGMNNLRWLEKQHPDVSPVIEYLRTNGFEGMTVATNGWDGVMYEYALEDQYPEARFDHITWFILGDEDERTLDKRVDFVICEDDYYGKQYPSERFRDILDGDCKLLEDFTIEHSWGETHALVFGRR